MRLATIAAIVLLSAGHVTEGPPITTLGTMFAEHHGGTNHIITTASMSVAYGLGPPSPYEYTPLFEDMRFTADDVGWTFVATAETDPYFNRFVSIITNGEDDYMTHRLSGGGYTTLESVWLTDSIVGGVDFAGAVVEKIALTVDFLKFNTPGDDPYGDGNWTDLDGGFTVAFRGVAPEGICGDGVIEVPEECDDGNADSGDGCSSICFVEDGWECSGEPSTCTLVLYVDTDATGANDGSSWCDAYPFLQDALAVAAASGGAITGIRVARGVYNPDQGIDQAFGDREATFQLVNGVALMGGYAGCGEADPDERDIDANETILNGDLLANDDPSPVSDCCAASGGIGCSNGACETAVCARYTRCCDTEWDEPCARLGVLLCCDICGNRCDNSYHVVTGSGTDVTAVLDGFTVRAGNADGSAEHPHGGGMYNVLGRPTVTNCTFVQNTADFYGGGMYNDRGSPTLTNCTFTGNTASVGGGMANDSSSPTVTNCTFTGNTSASGGGMYNTYGTTTVTNCTFTENRADGEGGGMHNGLHSSPTVTNCTFTGNTAWAGGGMFNGGHKFNVESPTVTNCRFTENRAGYHGGGMCNRPSEPTVANCTFIGNTTAGDGGGMYTFWGSPMVTNCTFTGNLASVSGGGMVNAGDGYPTVVGCAFSGNAAVSDGGAMVNTGGSYSRVTNCILWGDTPDEISNSGSTTSTIRFSDVQGDLPPGAIDGGGNIDADPFFVDADGLDDVPGTEDDNLRLSPGSPAIDAADNTAVPIGVSTDLDGNPRFIDDPYTPDTGNGTPPIVDMGAYESLGLCGNAVVDTGEGCDDGGESAICDANCTLVECGDGTSNATAGEECDDGLDNSDTDPDACRTDCMAPSCADGVVDTGEECDDGLDNSDTGPDACRTDCRQPWCGDGVVDTGEECDDGLDNSDTGPDACRTGCRLAWCGDGVVDTGEECDDGNSEPGDACDESCQIELGACCLGTACSATVQVDCLDSGGVFFGYNSTCDSPDADGDGLRNGCDGCPDDPNKIEPGECGCGVDEVTDSDEDGVPDCDDECPGVDDAIIAPGCDGAIPTVSTWGLVILGLLLLVGHKIHFSRRTV